MIRLVDLERNDLHGSLAYYLQCQTDGRWSPDRAQSVASLHDDPETFWSAVAASSGKDTGPRPIPAGKLGL